MEKKRYINCSFINKSSLYSAYMPFIKNGGLFIHTEIFEPIGTVFNLSIQLMSEQNSYLIDGKVVWITPSGAQGNRPAGVGLQFLGEKSHNLCNKIEVYLDGMLNSFHTTDTF